jgi:hypothetical protein
MTAERMTSASFPTSFLSVNPQLGRLAASPTEATPCREPLQAPEKAGNPHLDFPDSVKPYGSTAGGRKDRTVSPQAPLAVHLDFALDSRRLDRVGLFL